MRVDGVGACGDYFCAEFFEFFKSAVQIQKLRRADKRKVSRVEKKHEPLARKIVQRYAHDFIFFRMVCFQGEMWKFLIYCKHAFMIPVRVWCSFVRRGLL